MKKSYLKSNNCFGLILLLGLVSYQISYSQTINYDNLQLKEQDSFYLGSKSTLTDIWISGRFVPPKYFNEVLPSFFFRKINFNQFNLSEGELKWVFTGETGGITIIMKQDSIVFIQRYYDSYGFNSLQGSNWIATLYPEHIFSRRAIFVNSAVHSIALSSLHTMQLNLLVNDSLVIQELSQIDISRHQLQYSGTQGNIKGVLLVPSAIKTDLVLNRQKKYQQVIGFGGITTPTAYHMLSKEGKQLWWRYISEYNLMIQREYPIGKKLKQDYSNWDNLADASSHYYGDNFPNGEMSDFEYNDKLQKKGGMVIFEFWEFPPWSIDSTKPVGGVGLDASAIPKYEKFTELIINYCKTALNKTGKGPSIVGIQNELLQPKEIWQHMTRSLRKALDSSGFGSTKIHMHNSATLKMGIDAVKAFSEKKDVWTAIDYTAVNLYDYQDYFHNPDGYDSVIAEWNMATRDYKTKPFLSLEMSVNSNQYQSGSYRVAFSMGELYHKNLVQMNASVLAYCWLLVNTVQKSFSESRSLFTISEKTNFLPTPSSYQLRVFGAFSRHIKKGMSRFDVESGNKDLLVSGYSNGKLAVLVLLNKGIYSQIVNLASKIKIKRYEIANQYQENRSEQSFNSSEIKIEPGSIVTISGEFIN